MTEKSLGLWPLRALWVVVPLIVGRGIGQLLDEASDGVAAVAEVGLWAGWFAVLVALLAPSTASLTAARILTPMGPVGVLIGMLGSGGFEPWPLVSLVVLALAAVLVFLPWTGDVMINASAYGPERRMALRPPAALLLGPIELAWLVVFAGLVCGPLLLAAERWIPGAIAVVVGAVLVWFGTRSLHQLARRWIVFVPAGFVIHDYWVLAESLLLRRRDIETIGPAPLDKGEMLDLSGGARGLALMAQLTEPVPLALRARRQVQTFSAHRLVFTPSLPGSLLTEARVRGISVGVEPAEP